MAELSFLSLVFLVLAACEDSTTPGRTFVIRVDAVEAPPSVGRDAPLSLRFQGVIGPVLCPRFVRFDALQTTTRVELTLIGRFENPGGACPTALAELRGREYIKAPPHADSVQVVVHQPDGSTLELEVKVNSGP